MSKRIILQKATRIEGNANIEIEVDEGRLKSARFLVYDFRGFEKFMQGRRVEHIPSLVSRICGLCSAAHQVAGLKAIEDALGVATPRSVNLLREIVVLGEWISSHALSYFFLTMPDFVGASGGFFELMKTHPEVAREAYDLRKAGYRIVQLLGKRATHPVSLGIGGFLIPPTAAELQEVGEIAREVKNRTVNLIIQAGRTEPPPAEIFFPRDHQLNLFSYQDEPEGGSSKPVISREICYPASTAMSSRTTSRRCGRNGASPSFPISPAWAFPRAFCWWAPWPAPCRKGGRFRTRNY